MLSTDNKIFNFVLILVISVIAFYRNSDLFNASFIVYLLILSLFYLQYLFSIKHKSILLLTGYVILILLLIVVTHNNIYDSSDFELTSIEKYVLTIKHSFLKIGLIGQLYGRKIGYFYFENLLLIRELIIKRIAVLYDLSLYFSSNNLSLFPLWLLPFFVIGIVRMLKDNLGDILFYLFVATLFSLLISIAKTPFLFLPFFIVMIANGILITINSISKLKLI